MSKPIIVIADGDQVIEREMTDFEYDKYLLTQIPDENEESKRLQKIANDAETKRQKALEKLAQLGINLEDLKALGLA